MKQLRKKKNLVTFTKYHFVLFLFSNQNNSLYSIAALPTPFPFSTIVKFHW